MRVNRINFNIGLNNTSSIDPESIDIEDDEIDPEIEIEEDEDEEEDEYILV